VDSALQLTILTAAGFIGGLVDSIAGGGGLITLPALLWAGLPPHLALGTNKLQSSFGSLTATVSYIQNDVVVLRDEWPGVVLTLIGAAAGTISVQLIDADFLRVFIPYLLTAVLIYTVAKPKLGQAAGRQRMSKLLFYLVFGLGLGFYDGFFGPGAGSFWTVAMLLFLGVDFVAATGRTKLMNFTSNFTALVVFLIGGNVVFTLGLAMGLGQMIGARVGSGMVIKRGAGFIRPVFLTMVLLVTLKLWWDAIVR